MGFHKISVEVEVDFDGDFDTYRVTVFHRGLKFPILNGFDGLFIEPHSKTAQHADVAWAAIRTDNQA